MNTAVSDILILIVVIVLLWFAWAATGGPKHYSESHGLLLSTGSQGIGGTILSGGNTSHPYAQSISIDASNAYGDTPESEYITLSMRQTILILPDGQSKKVTARKRLLALAPKHHGKAL